MSDELSSSVRDDDVGHPMRSMHSSAYLFSL
jgi:hypothetical protein